MSKTKKEIETLRNIDDISDILQRASEILGNPIVLFDTSYNLLYNTRYVLTDDIFWNELVNTGTFSQKTVDFFNTANFILECAKSEVVSKMDSPQIKYSRINGKLFDKDNIQIANICIVACNKNFKNEDIELIEFLCEILSERLQKSGLSQRINKVYGKSVLSNIINGKKIKQKDIATLYKDLKSNLYIAVVDISGYDKTNTHLAYFRDVFKKLQPEFKYFIHLNHIVIILSTHNKFLSLKKDINSLNTFFKENNIYCGISSKCCDLTQIRKQHTEAINALNLGLKSPIIKANIFYYDNFLIEHFLNVTCGSVNIKELYHPIIQEIIEYDKVNNSQLLNILYVCIVNNLDAQRTIKDLNISDEDYKNAMLQLEEVFEIDLKNADMYASLYLSIKMLDRYK